MFRYLARGSANGGAASCLGDLGDELSLPEGSERLQKDIVKVGIDVSKKEM
jgi:hypothetical protein